MDKRQVAQQAVEDTINKVHAYMCVHPHSELHRQGKMFGVLVCERPDGGTECLRAFSAMLDGSYEHEGFVPPVYLPSQMPIGATREESQRLQRLLFAEYRFTNIHSETRDLLEIFAHEKPIVSMEEWFAKSSPLHVRAGQRTSLPPAGAGECCAPKLLQYAFFRGWKAHVLAEFWIGASPHTELRREGVFYPPCSGKCVPILRYMLQGQELEIWGNEKPDTPEWKTIEVLYEDDTLMVVNKPAGMLSVPGKSDEPSVAEYLMAQRPGSRLQPVHRLDQDTSGLLILAKTADAYIQLQRYFQRRDILKRYEALLVTSERMNELTNEGGISLPLLPNPYDRPRQMVELVHGKPAITTYRVRERRNDGTLFLDFYPHTGRTHQLRVHAAHPDGLNAPIKGDRLYGTPADRLYLHAAEIRFVHPVTKEEMHFCIPSRF